MKYFHEGAMYIQKQDAMEIIHDDGLCPARFMVALTHGGYFYCNGGTDKYSFVNVTDPDAIKWLREQDWILDYEKVKDMTEIDVIEYGQLLANKRNEITRMYNKMRIADQRGTGVKLVMECKRLIYKMNQVEDYLHYLKGELELNLPEK